MFFLRTVAVLVLAPVVAGLAGCGTHPQRPAAAPASSQAAVPSSKAVSAPPACGDPTALPLRAKLAQLLMVGVRDAADARAVVTDHQVGGIFLGSWTELSILTDGSLADIARQSVTPLAVSVDEEGGRVSRLSALIGAAPSARVLAQTHTPDEVYGMALERGRTMHGLGITVDFAPVVDVSEAPDDTVIGDRSFSADPAVVTAYGQAYARGLRDAGLLPVLKHFPGHGHGSGDSHTGEVSTPPLDELIGNDLLPYRTLVSQAPVGVMVGHLRVPGLTGDQPASVSPAALQLLRGGTGYGGPPFNGPVFSDDLSGMAAITDRYGVAEAALSTLQAGTDIALWLSTDQVPAVLDRLERAVAAGELTTSGIDASVRRVAAVKGANPRCGR